MKKIIYLMIALPFLIIFSCSPGGEKENNAVRKVEIKEGAYYINGDKTFINALGYEIGARPGQHPYVGVRKSEPARVKHDLSAIKEAGFNAIRTWSELTEEEVKVVQESGLMLVYGIWILPDGDFDKVEFLIKAEQQVRRVMSWSKNYDCIITYLLMNEPMPAHIHDKGALNTLNMWKNLTGIIHDEHPGIPVTISNNSAIGEYLNENIFDVYGYNCYDYNEGLPGFTQGFSNHFNYLKDLNGQDKPVLVTEFGLSVSPLNFGGMYGGNTRKQQAERVIKNFGELLDSDVAGICPFYYADGWWKGGEPAVHNPVPEEWFGYWGYADGSDTIGLPRPVWYELKKYNQAIVASPRNHKIYTGPVPLEFYLSPAVNRAKVIWNDMVVYDQPATAGHFTAEIDFKEEGITDRELVLEFYNNKGELLKWESVMILTSKKPVKLPEIRLTLNSNDLGKVKNLEVRIDIKKDSIFSLDKNLRVLFSHHVGWNPGEHRTISLEPDREEYSLTESYLIPGESLLLNVAAGLDIKYGKFVKRIYNQELVYRGDWADPIRVK